MAPDDAADGRARAGGLNANWPTAKTGRGLTDLLLGGQGANLAELVNTYYVMRYRARPGTPAHAVTGNNLERLVRRDARGRVGAARPQQRHAVRAAHLELLTTTRRSSLHDARADRPPLPRRRRAQRREPRGHRLLELYQTVLNSRITLAVARLNDPNANKQADGGARASRTSMRCWATRPIRIRRTRRSACGRRETLEHLEFLPGSTFCFQNQVPTLLDEELALLRGRTRAVAPNLTTYPCYNRLMWNFTKGHHRGRGRVCRQLPHRRRKGRAHVDQAAEMYPQGHGDAYGHYLSAVWGTIGCLRNPTSPGAIRRCWRCWSASRSVNMDYADERKFSRRSPPNWRVQARTSSI